MNIPNYKYLHLDVKYMTYFGPLNVAFHHNLRAFVVVAVVAAAVVVVVAVFVVLDIPLSID